MKRARMAIRTRERSTNDELEELGIVPISEVVHPRSWAIYGRSGTGKTTFASTFPPPILLLDIRDKGTDSIADLNTVDYKRIESFDDVEEIYYFLKKSKRYKTVVFDTITQLQQLCMEEVVGNKRKKDAGDWGGMTKREFGDVAAKMKEWVLNFRDLPMEVVFLAQERTTRGDEDDDNPDRMLVPEVGPQVMPSIAGHLNAAVAVIGNTFIRTVVSHKPGKGGKRVATDKVRYSMRIGPNPVYTTKTRKPRGIEIPPLLDDPTYKDVIELFKGE